MMKENTDKTIKIFLCLKLTGQSSSPVNFTQKTSFLEDDKRTEIHLTGAATNPWIRFESDHSFIKFEIGTN